MLGLLSLIRKPWLLVALGIAGAFTVGFWRGHEAGSDAAKVAQLEAQLAAERNRARREAALAKRLEREKSDLREALDQIDAEAPFESGGAECVLDPSVLRQLRAAYSQD